MLTHFLIPGPPALFACAPQIHTQEGPGDILVFLTGQDEIESLERLLQVSAPLVLDRGTFFTFVEIGRVQTVRVLHVDAQGSH